MRLERSFLRILVLKADNVARSLSFLESIIQVHYGSLYFSYAEKVPTYPSPKSTLTLTSLRAKFWPRGKVGGAVSQKRIIIVSLCYGRLA